MNSGSKKASRQTGSLKITISRLYHRKGKYGIQSNFRRRIHESDERTSQGSLPGRC